MPENALDSSETIASLLVFLGGMETQRREAGRTAQLRRSVLKIVPREGYRLLANVSAKGRLHAVDVHHGSAGWSSVCTCGQNDGCGCEHAAAAVYDWIAHVRARRESDGGIELPEVWEPKPPRPAGSFRQQWEPVIAEKLGRPLSSNETSFLGRLATVYHNMRQRGGVARPDLHHLGFKTNESRGGWGWAYTDWWDRLPSDPMALWQYIAYDVERSGLQIPEFMRPVTDTATIRQHMAEKERRQAIDQWKQRFAQLASVARHIRPATTGATPEPIELRVRVLPYDLQIETRTEASAPWKKAPSALLRRIAEDDAFALSLATTPELAAFLALFRPYGDDRRRGYSVQLEHDLAQMLVTLLSNPLTRPLVVGPGGEPLSLSAEPLTYRLTHSEKNPRDYELALSLPDGTTVGDEVVSLGGLHPVFIVRSEVYLGPPPLADNHGAKTVVPAEAVERSETVTVLRSLGAKLPPDLEARLVTVPVRVEIECSIQVSPFSTAETVRFRLTGISDGPAVKRTWQLGGWNADFKSPRSSSVESKLITFDLRGANAVMEHFARLNAGWDSALGGWVRRLTRNFPDEFLAWREGLPPGVEVLATGELASLLGAPVKARIDFEVIESKVHRDWFDLALALKPEDSSLTTEELALLLKARGKLVRIPGKGWRRLAVELDAGAEQALTALGFDPRTAGEAALAGERQRVHALQLANTNIAERLTESQAAILRERAQAITRIDPPDVPPRLRAELRPYQREGFHFLTFLSSNRLGGVLADDMGLGKTVQTLAWLLWLAGRQIGRPLRALVICPKSVMSVWRAEAARFAPDLRVVPFSPSMARVHKESPAPTDAPGARKGSPTDSATENAAVNGGTDPAAPELVVANYAQVRLHAPYFQAQPWHALVLDEGQFIKTPGAKIAQIARELPGEHRIVLTGTPIENRLLDLWSLFAFAMPGLLGSQVSFKRHYADDDPLALPRLRSRVRHFLLRRTKLQVAQDLPPRVEEDLFVDLEGDQAKLYQAELKRARAQLLGVETPQDFQRSRFNILASLLRLRQICCHPALVDSAHRALPSAKLDDLMERVQELAEEGHQVLLFSQFVEMLELIRGRLQQAGIGHLMLTGQTDNREELVRDFGQDRSRTVFLLSLKAAGFGLNLTSASYVILYDPWWNPAVEAQAIDRTHRIGQTMPVNAYRFIARGTIEEKIRALQREKAALAASIVQEESLANVLDLDSLRTILA